ncbi:MAG: DUF4407 domain-containing protein [Actinophytocola sp.]|uniref:DUF4407 domain-containing protein n=1 Tax=Actinophytocola sp. TaxID=1872138 RepID=UPI003C762984
MAGSTPDDHFEHDVLAQPGLGLLPGERPTAENRGQRAGQALRWLAGVNEELLAWVPGERAKYTALGGVVLGTATIAAFSMAIALTEVLGGFHVLILLPVLIWGVFIANLDRWLVSTSTVGRWGRRAGLFVPRLVLAFAFGVVIAEPLVLRVFESAIEEHIHQERAAAVTVLESGFTRCNPAPTADEQTRAATREAACASYRLGLETGFEAIQQDVAAKRATADTLAETIRNDSAEQARRDILASNECSGTRAPGSTGRIGRGPECQAREAEAAEYRNAHPTAEHQEKLRELRDEIGVLEAGLSSAQQNYEDTRADAIAGKVAEMRASQGAIGLLERFGALTKLTEDNAVLTTVTWFIRLFFIAIDCLPVVVKFISGTSRYDELVEAHSSSAQKVYGQSVRTMEGALLSDLRGRQHETASSADMVRSATDHKRRLHEARLDVDLDHQVTALAAQLRGGPAYEG